MVTLKGPFKIEKGDFVGAIRDQITSGTSGVGLPFTATNFKSSKVPEGLKIKNFNQVPIKKTGGPVIIDGEEEQEEELDS